MLLRFVLTSRGPPRFGSWRQQPSGSIEPEAPVVAFLVACAGRASAHPRCCCTRRSPAGPCAVCRGGLEPAPHLLRIEAGRPRSCCWMNRFLPWSSKERSGLSPTWCLPGTRVPVWEAFSVFQEVRKAKDRTVVLATQTLSVLGPPGHPISA